MTADLSDLVVEILHNRGDDNHPDWSVGSGFFVDTKLVLTALHNVDGPGELLVRVHGKEEYPAVARLKGNEDIVDLAVLEVSNVAVDVPKLYYGVVDRSAPAVVEQCWAIGFPQLKVLDHERGKPKPPPSSAHVNGEIPTGEYLGQQLLTLQVRRSPRPQSQGSEWEGMSGAVVFSGDYIVVGVITEHHLPEGESALTVEPITAIDLLPEGEATKWWKLLGADRQTLVRLPDNEREQRLRSQRSRRCDFYQYITPSAHYVSRQEVLDTVRSALLADLSDGMTSSPSSRPLALHGMGGIGKSIIARALCDDPEIQNTFADGILWVTLGKEPELVSAMRQWVQVLGGTISENVPTIDSLKDLLAKLLKDRICLLIIDDVWRRSHADAFCVGGPRCRILLTTRDTEIVGELGAKVQSIPVMTEAESITLLEEWSDGHLTGTESKLKGQIVKRLGLLPLAVKLAGAQLQRKQAEEWLQAFAVRKLKSPRPEGIHDSLEQTFNLSLDELDKGTRHLYVSLSIFKEDEATPQVGIELLWQSLDNFDAASTTDLLDDLASRALLEVTSYRSSRVVRLHDLLHDLTDMELNDERVTVHQALLRAYRMRCKGTGWHTADDDGYLYDHLAYHLHAAGAVEDLRELFVNQDWLYSRFSKHGYTYDGYLEDLSQAWMIAADLASRQIEAGDAPSAFADCVRFALIQSSINTVAGNLVPQLVARAVETRLWTLDRALSIIARVADPARRAELYTAVLRTIVLDHVHQDQVQHLALDSFAMITDDRSRWHVQMELFPVLSPGLIQQALTSALANASEVMRAQLLTAALPYLSGKERQDILRRALMTAMAIGDSKARVYALVALVKHLRGLRLQLALQRGLLAAREISDEKERVHALVALVPSLSGEQEQSAVREAQTAASAITDPKERVHAWSALVPYLAPDDAQAAVQAALDAVPTIVDQKERAYAVAALAPRLKDTSLQRGQESAQAMTEAGWRSFALTALALQFEGDMRSTVQRQALKSALEDSEERQRGWLLAGLAPQLKGSLLNDCLEVALAILREQSRAEALISLAEQFIGERQEQVVEKALRAIEGIPASNIPSLNWQASNWQARDQSVTLSGLASMLTDALIDRGLAIALAIEEEQPRSEALAALAPKLVDASLEQALTPAVTILDDWEQAQTLAHLAPYASGETQLQAVRAALAASTILPRGMHLGNRTLLLTKLALQVSGEPRSLVLEVAWNSALETVSPYFPLVSIQYVHFQFDSWRRWNRPLYELAPILTESLIDDTLGRTRKSDRGELRAEVVAEVVAALAPYLTKSLLKRALKVALETTDNFIRSVMLSALAPYLTSALRKQTIEREVEVVLAEPESDVVLTELESMKQAIELTKLAPYLSNDQKDQVLGRALNTALSLQEEWRAMVLVSLADQLTGKLLEQALNVSLAIENVLIQSQALTALATQLTGEERIANQRRVLIAARQVEKQKLGQGSYLVEKIAPQLSGVLLEEALAAVLEFELSESRTYALVSLMPQLTTPLLLQAFEATRKLPDPPVGWGRHQARITLMRYAPDELLPLCLQEIQALPDTIRYALLATVAPRLTGELLQRGLNMAAEIVDEILRARTLALFLPFVSDQAPLLKSIRFILLHKLLKLAEYKQQRGHVLNFCALEDLFTPPILLPETLTTIAQYIMEACHDWRWL